MLEGIWKGAGVRQIQKGKESLWGECKGRWGCQGPDGGWQVLRAFGKPAKVMFSVQWTVSEESWNLHGTNLNNSFYSFKGNPLIPNTVLVDCKDRLGIVYKNSMWVVLMRSLFYKSAPLSMVSWLMNINGDTWRLCISDISHQVLHHPLN